MLFRSAADADAAEGGNAGPPADVVGERGWSDAFRRRPAIKIAKTNPGPGRLDPSGNDPQRGPGGSAQESSLVRFEAQRQREGGHTENDKRDKAAHIDKTRDQPEQFAACSNTWRSISAVSFPVEVFCWLGW